MIDFSSEMFFIYHNNISKAYIDLFLFLASEMNLTNDKRNNFNLTTQSGSEFRRHNRQRSLRESLEEQEEEESLALMIDHTNAFNSSTLEINVESSSDGSSLGRSAGSGISSSVTRSNNSNQYTLSGSRNKSDLMQV